MDSGMTNGLDSEENLEEGGLYVVRKGKLELVPRNDDEGMRRVRVTDGAYQKAMDIGQRMRKDLGGYKPDVSLVISAILLGGIDEEKAKRMVRKFVLKMFSEAGESDEDQRLERGENDSIRTSQLSVLKREENP